MPARHLLALARLSVLAAVLLLTGSRIPSTSIVQSSAAALESARILRRPETGRASLVTAAPGRPIPPATPLIDPSDHTAAALAFLKAHGNLFGLDDAARQLSVLRTDPSGADRWAVRFQELHRGVPVLGAQLIVHVDAAGNTLAAAGEVSSHPDVDVRPALDAESARQCALAFESARLSVDQAALEAYPAELWVYDPSLMGIPGSPPRLVWRVEVRALAPAPARGFLLVDGHDGRVLDRLDALETVRYREVYDNQLFPGLSPDEGVLARVEGQEGATNILPVDSAYLYSGDTYDFLQAYFGLDSLDNDGMPLRSVVRYFVYTTDPNPALMTFWWGDRAVFSENFSRADDVVGHEFTHGLIENTAGLIYQGQSGAISEAYADLFGELVDWYNDPSYMLDPDWLIGEDLESGWIRGMQFPEDSGLAGRMTSHTYFLGAADNGGVHINNGIGDFAAYLMASGGSVNDYTIKGIGAEKVGKIWYWALIGYLTPATDYLDLHNALCAACLQNIGNAGITTADCESVRAATLAVEMDVQPTAHLEEPTPMCAGDVLPEPFLTDNFEGMSLSPLWTLDAPNLTASARWLLFPESEYGFTSPGFLHVDNKVTLRPQSAALTLSQPLPKHASLTFAQVYDFRATTCNAGVLEYSLDGVNWQDAAPLMIQGGYPDRVPITCPGPLAGRPAYIGVSGGYVVARLDLATLAGKTPSFRWRYQGDQEHGDGWGWLVDDVHIFRCPKIEMFIPFVGR